MKDPIVKYVLLPLVVLAAIPLAIAIFQQPDSLPIPEDSNPNSQLASEAVPKIETAEPEFSLPEAERQYLWDLEHHSNLLGKYGFTEVINAWKAADGETLAKLLSPDFEGRLVEFTQAPNLEAKSSLLDVTRRKADETTPPATAAEFVDWLLAVRARFPETPAPDGRFDVMRLTPPEEDGDPSWTARCLFRVWGKSPDGGPLEVTFNLKLTTHEISEERLAEDGWMRTCEFLQADVAHSKTLLFSDTTHATGIDPKQFHDNWFEKESAINTGGLYACDFNQDGFCDLFITDIKGSRFYVGLPEGRFEDATVKLGLLRARDALLAGFADLDNDGWVDLILPRTGRIFRNNSGKMFTEVTSRSNLQQLLMSMPAPPSAMAGVVPGDFNRDGLIDLYVTRAIPPTGSWLESKQPDLVPNQLFINQGEFSFIDATTATNAGGGGLSCFSAVWSDMNGDQWPDLYLINEFGNGSLLVNQEGKRFESRELVDNQNDFGSMGLTCGDINNDGNIDLYVSNMYSKAGSRIMGNMKAECYPDEVKQRLHNMVAGGELYSNTGDLKFKPLGKEYQVNAAGWAWGSALADFDNDGWLDLHVTAGFISRDREKPDG